MYDDSRYLINIIDNMKSIKVKPKIEELNNIKFFIEDYIKHKDMKLNLIIEEIYTNIINYSQTEYVIINSDFDEKNNKILIEFVDNGTEFNPLKKMDYEVPNSVKEAKIGGLGIHLVKNFADSIEYNYDGENHLTITKKVE